MSCDPVYRLGVVLRRVMGYFVAMSCNFRKSQQRDLTLLGKKVNKHVLKNYSILLTKQ